LGEKKRGRYAPIERAADEDDIQGDQGITMLMMCVKPKQKGAAAEEVGAM